MSDKVSVFVLSSNQRLREIVALYLSELENFYLFPENLTNSELYNEITSLPHSILLVDMNEDFSEQMKRIYSDCPACKIVAIKDVPDVNFIVNTIRMGAKDILAYPLIKSDFHNTLERLAKDFFAQNKQAQKCKIISVFSNKGGIGKTCIASNLAYELAQSTKDKVALIDLNFQTGDISTFMGLEPTYEISYIFENMKHFSGELIESLMCKYKETSLYVLTNPPGFEQGKAVSQKVLTDFFTALKSHFDYVVVDLNSLFDNQSISTMKLSDLVLLVTIVNLPALRNCQRCLEMFDKLGFDSSKIQVLVNRFMENDEISADDVVELLEKQIYWKLPNNYFAVMNAINKGILLSEVNRNSNISASYRELARYVADSVFRERMSVKFDTNRLKTYNKVLEDKWQL